MLVLGEIQLLSPRQEGWGGWGGGGGGGRERKRENLATTFALKDHDRPGLETAKANCFNCSLWEGREKRKEGNTLFYGHIFY